MPMPRLSLFRTFTHSTVPYSNDSALRASAYCLSGSGRHLYTSQLSSGDERSQIRRCFLGGPVKVSPHRKEIRRRGFFGTLANRQAFAKDLFQRFVAVVKQTQYQAFVLGDGAKWIWEMTDEYYPKALQILDFYHVTEYI